ncbi:MAG TPA: IgGFc-binding protein [Kofleriaceae bacterium]|nr:IgGFc-binding protein [Kofleriaceae bacterium]
MRSNIIVSSAALLLAVACGPSARTDGPNCTSICSALGFQQCREDGTFEPIVACSAEEVCDPVHGCVVCVAGQTYCGGPDESEVWKCNAEGTGGTKSMDCPGDTVCSQGTCKDACERALDEPSNVGCDFWAADLDNEPALSFLGASSDAAAAQFSVVVANNNDYEVAVKVTKNGGRVGQPLNEQIVTTVAVPPKTAKRIDLPQRELDGTMGQNGAYVPASRTHTFVSPHAYHVVSTGPVVAYQFNPIVQQYSNDASTLIPVQALGTNYFVMGYQTANPCALAVPGFNIDSIPDHGAITIIPIEDNTQVTVVATHPIVKSGGDSGLVIPSTPAGTPLTFKLNRYDVANLESDQPADFNISECMKRNGDFTGTQILSDKKILVFMAMERGAGFGGATPAPTPSPNWTSQDGMCCTDHLEEQLLPTTALGKEFAVTRSPIRSTDPSWTEPDIVRVLATEDNTTVTTTAPGVGTFTLNKGKQRTFPATAAFTLSADKAIMVAQVLVSQHYIPDGFIGDPSMLILPTAEQYRKDYVFLVPGTFRDNYVVMSKPVDAAVVLDGTPLGMRSNCKTAPIGTVAGTVYEQITCTLTDGQHTLASDKPVGISIYGYYNVGSYAFVGGSDVKIINPVE